MALHGQRTFVGFGFGPIQTGLFIYEAFSSGNFGRIVVTEVDRELVEAVRSRAGRFSINVAHADGIRSRKLGPIEILDPAAENDRELVVSAIARASEVATAVPSTKFYRSDDPGSVHRLLARGLERRGALPLAVYAAENHNRAASILREAVLEEVHREKRPEVPAATAFLDTVIGKMSGVISSPKEIEERGIEPLVPGLARAHLVESFNRILVARPSLSGGIRVDRGITVFEEKSDLDPFEEAKLYGHNAAHALAGYVALPGGLTRLSQLAEFPGALDFVRAAFLEESGRALIHRHGGKDPLFTRTGFRSYADDLLDRMLNPHLGDLVHRVVRDPERKLGWNDRLVGTMRLALEAGTRPWRFAIGAAAALDYLRSQPESRAVSELPAGRTLSAIWAEDHPDRESAREIARLIQEGRDGLARIADGKPFARP